MSSATCRSTRLFRGLGPGPGRDPPDAAHPGPVLLFVVVMSVVNLPALSRIADRDRARLERRVGDLPPIGPEDRVYVVMIQDPLFAVNRDPAPSSAEISESKC